MREGVPFDNNNVPDNNAPTVIGSVDWSNARKASLSMDQSICIEVAFGEGLFGLRDSKQEGVPELDRPRIVVGTGTAAIFFAGIKADLYNKFDK